MIGGCDDDDDGGIAVERVASGWVVDICLYTFIFSSTWFFD